MGIALLSVHAPHNINIPLSQFHSSNTKSCKSFSQTYYPLQQQSKSNSTAIILCSAAAVDDTPPPPPPPPDDSLPVKPESVIKELSPSACKSCGREAVEKGCNGKGSIQGGIATFPGFGWWPIKAYRPCPGFLESGGRYKRQGQSLDEVAFGRGGRDEK